MSEKKTLLITGASSGIGRSTAELAVQSGWQVALLARSKDKLNALASELGEAAKVYPCDVSSWKEVQSAVDSASSDFGGLDAVFANAGRGIGSGGFTGGDPEDWDDLVRVNILGVMYTVRAAAEALKRSKGRLLITGSVAGRRVMKGSVYGATKWGVSGIGYNLESELSEQGISITLIEPGMVDTAFFDEEKPDALRPSDVAEVVCFALSRPSRVSLPQIRISPLRS